MVFFGCLPVYAVEMRHLLADPSAYKPANNEGDFNLIKQLLSGDFKALDDEMGEPANQ